MGVDWFRSTPKVLCARNPVLAFWQMGVTLLVFVRVDLGMGVTGFDMFLCKKCLLMTFDVK
jgi:hypothetical protein